MKWSTVEKALLDSGVMDNFIDHRTTEQLGIQTEPLNNQSDSPMSTEQPTKLDKLNDTAK